MNKISDHIKHNMPCCYILTSLYRIMTKDSSKQISKLSLVWLHSDFYLLARHRKL